MTGFQLSFTFFISWFIVIFTVLPWGNSPDKDAKHSQSMGMPAKPRMWLKAAITTLLALLITGIAHLIVISGWISLRP